MKKQKKGKKRKKEKRGRRKKREKRRRKIVFPLPFVPLGPQIIEQCLPT